MKTNVDIYSMEFKKTLTDRLNHLKSELKQLTSAKMDKRATNEIGTVVLNARIKEVEWLLGKADWRKDAFEIAKLLAEDEYLTYEEAESIINTRKV